MKPSARGLTLMEILAAMALLGLLAAALSSWLQLTSAYSIRLAATLPWEAAAEQVLQRIHEDLLIDDFVPAPAPGKDAPKEPRCNVVDGKLTIRTRDPHYGPVQRDYLFESSGGRLKQATRPVSTSGKQTETRLLVGGVAAWTCEMDSKMERLSVSLTSTTGATIRRSFACSR